jgi:hypothetical protein
MGGALMVVVVGAWATCTAEIAVTNEPQDPVAHLLQVVWNAPVVVGNNDDVVEPLTYILFELSRATPTARLFALYPPRYVENRTVAAAGSRTPRNALDEAPPGQPSNAFCWGKSAAVVCPATYALPAESTVIAFAEVYTLAPTAGTDPGR